MFKIGLPLQKISKNFPKFPLSGESLSRWTKEDFKSVIGDVQRITLYNAIQKLKGKHFI